MENEPEIERLKTELSRAYRALHAYSNAQRKGELLNETAVGYHIATVGAAARFVHEQSLDGSAYFVGKHISVLHEALEPRS